MVAHGGGCIEATYCHVQASHMQVNMEAAVGFDKRTALSGLHERQVKLRIPSVEHAILFVM